MRASPIEGGRPGRVMRIVIVTPAVDARLAVVLTPRVLTPVVYLIVVRLRLLGDLPSSLRQCRGEQGLLDHWVRPRDSVTAK